MMNASAFRPRRLVPRSLSPRAETLLDELEELFLTEGFRDLSIASLATQLRTSRRTFYELAPSRDELVLVVLDRIMHRMGKEAHDRLTGVADPLDRIEEYFAAAATGLRRMSLRFTEDVERQPSAQRLLADHYRYAAALMQEVVEEAIETGRARRCNPHFVAEAIDAIIVRLHDPEYRQRSPLSVEESLYEAQRFVRAALELPGAPASRRPKSPHVVLAAARSGSTSPKRRANAGAK
jgi:AcrR family transcriptional regulator